MSPANGAHWRVACPQPMGHRPHPRVVPGSWQTQPPETSQAPLVASTLQHTVAHAAQGEGTGVRCRHEIPLEPGSGHRTDPSFSPELQGEGPRAPQWVLGPPPHPGHGR